MDEDEGDYELEAETELGGYKPDKDRDEAL